MSVVVEADGRATRWDGHKAERRELILDAAIEAVSDEGAQVGVQHIAALAGLPRSVVYRIFRDREDLDEQIRARIVERLMTELSPALTPRGTLQEWVNGAVKTYLGWVMEFPRLHQFLGSGSASRRTTGSRVVTGTKTAIAAQLAEFMKDTLRDSGADPSVAEPLAFGLIGLVDGSVNRWVSNPDAAVSSTQLGAFLADAIWQVLCSALAREGLSITSETALDALG